MTTRVPQKRDEPPAEIISNVLQILDTYAGDSTIYMPHADVVHVRSRLRHVLKLLGRTGRLPKLPSKLLRNYWCVRCKDTHWEDEPPLFHDHLSFQDDDGVQSGHREDVLEGDGE